MYRCGGADYQDLFKNWEDLADENYSAADTARARRPAGAPKLEPGAYAQILATRCEGQLASDWLLAPAARNLHWRYSVLHNAFCLTTQQATLDPDLEGQIGNLLDNDMAVV